MKAKVVEMVKNLIMSGLKRSGYDVLKTSLGYPGGGLFTSSEDRTRAYQFASIYLDSLQGQAKTGRPSPLPSTPADLERYIDIHLAEMSFMDAYAKINSRFASLFADRNNVELVKEAREAIEQLKRLGGDAAKTANSYEWMLKKRIGEE